MPTEIVGKGSKPKHPGSKVVYSEYTDDEAEEKLEELRQKIYKKLAMLHEQGTIGLQENLDAVNAGGKDGTVARTYAVNPEWVHTHNFKGPEGEEKQHVAEPNWRFMQEFARSPGCVTLWCRGPIGDATFIDMTPAGKGKSAAEIHDLRATRVAGIKELQLGTRYGLPMNNDGHIDPKGLARFPSMVVNVFLNASYNEQGERLLDRLEKKVIKAGHPDLKEHFESFDHDLDAFGQSLSMINTPDAPVWVIPADNKKQASLAHAQLINGLLKLIDPSEPTSNPDVSVAERQHYIQLLQRELAAEKKHKA
jgi:polyphosphate kinase 2 (PPK2 family)